MGRRLLSGDTTTVITRSSVLSTLVKGLRCLECGAASLVIRVADHRLGLVAAMETACTECDTVLNSTLTSDRIDGSSSGNVPFVVVRQTVAASIDMGLAMPDDDGTVVRRVYRDIDSSIGHDDTIDFTVSYDGS
ncbi:hypothetical protein NP493_32g00010 [Ridgeia piscesae]|uniref:Uncharacterized protein n=1 Tax=Ridgeia piscesae TaxID=27915 RepID=A0AAD9PCX4_RIDPI|nr:hypothetical protein NP493_32g00010 [Ridgeia piscesae]